MRFIVYRSQSRSEVRPRRALPRAGLLAGLALAACLAFACSGPQTSIETPAGFVTLDEDSLYWDEIYRAVSADGAVIVVRIQDNAKNGTVDFWAEALRGEIVNGRGYELIDEGGVTAGVGNGHRLRMRGTLDERIYRYDLSIFVLDEERVLTVENVAPEEIWEERASDFEAALASLRLE